MKTIAAFAAWNNRIAPVFDVSENILVIEVDDGRIVRESRHVLAAAGPEEKAGALAGLGAEVLVCGAISRFLHDRLAAAGVQVVPFIAGDLAAIIRAWMRGELDRAVYAMPGCWNGRQRNCRGGYFEEVNPMINGRGRGAGLGRGGRGMGRGAGDGMGRGGGPRAAGPGGLCVCPKCGHAEPHETGVQCFERMCPKCGTVMTRG